MKLKKYFVYISISIIITASLSGCRIPFLSTEEGISIFPDGVTAASSNDVFEALIDGMSKNQESIFIFHKTDTPLTAQDIVQAIPGLYQVSINTVSVFGGYNYLITYRCWDNFAISYAYTNNDISHLTDVQREILDKYKEIYNAITSPSNTVYDNELAIHDYLVDNLTYDDSVTTDDAYNALFNGIAVCAGYTECFKTFMDMMGVENTAITGTADGQSHIWNEVKLEDNWYHVDVTWDDPLENYGKREHLYFNITDNDINLDHQYEKNPIYYRPATSTEYSYIYKSDVKNISNQDELSSYITECFNNNLSYTEFYSKSDLTINSTLFFDAKYVNFAYIKEPRDNYIMYSIIFIYN